MAPIDGTVETVIHWTSVGAVLLALAVSLVVATRLSEDGDLLAPLRKRFVLGVPWGTAIVVVAVYGFYHLVQGGGEPGGPIIVGFRSWSLWYPQSMLFSSFAHANDGHLISNLLGTVAFATIAEYAWSHYPTARGSASFSAPRTNPFVRIGLFVVAVFLVGIAGSLFVPGAVIGFSGVVFAFAGFAIVTRPAATVFSILGIQAVALVRRALLDPFGFAAARPDLVTPTWARTALQGHVFGLLVGVLLAVWLVRKREAWPNLRYVWFAALVFAVTRSIHAVYWFLSEDTFLFFRGIGTALVLGLASLVAVAALRADRPRLPAIELSTRTAAAGLLLAVVCALALVGIPYNLVPVSPGEEVEAGIDVGDYTVTYAENVENQYVSALEVPVVRESLTVNVSGVIVASDRRNAWEVATTKRQLALHGWTVVPLGDATWRERVVVNRTEWILSPENRTYKVFGRQVGEDGRTLLFRSAGTQARATIDGKRISIRPTREFYEVVVERNGSEIGAAQIPSHNESVQVGGITFERDGTDLLARHELTEIEVATYSTSGRKLQF